jgi:hypothetical protein
MATRGATRLILVLGGLALVTVLVVGALSVLAAQTPAQATSLLERNQVVASERETKAPVDGERARDTSPTPVVALVFAGIVLLAALPPAHRIHVYHRSYHGSDWI